MEREFPIANGKLVTDLDANGFKILNTQGGGGSGGTTDYNDLDNKPKIGDVEVSGSKSAEDYGLATKEQLNAVGNIAQGAADDTSFAIGEVNKLQGTVAQKRDRTDNIAAKDEVQITEWKFHCDVPEIQAALDANPPIVNITEITHGELWSYAFWNLPAVEGWEIDETYGHIVHSTPDETTISSDRYLYHKDYSEGAVVTATRERTVTTKSGEPYVTPTGVKALTGGKQDALTPSQQAAVDSGITGEILDRLVGAEGAAVPNTKLRYGFESCDVDDGEQIAILDRRYNNIVLAEGTASFTLAYVDYVGDSEGSVGVRDCAMVIEVAKDETPPSITWCANFHPRTDAETDFACVAGVRNVYWITEYAPNEFVVAGWQETTGGNAQ